MTNEQQAIIDGMVMTWIGNPYPGGHDYGPAFRVDCERLVEAGKIVVAIGAAVTVLQTSPELCDMLHEMIENLKQHVHVLEVANTVGIREFAAVRAENDRLNLRIKELEAACICLRDMYPS